MDKTSTWEEAVAPVVRKLVLAKHLNVSTEFNPKGARALAALLEKIAAEAPAYKPRLDTIAGRLKLSAALGTHCVFPRDSSVAMAEALREIARELDQRKAPANRLEQVTGWALAFAAGVMLYQLLRDATLEGSIAWLSDIIGGGCLLMLIIIGYRSYVRRS